MRKILGITAAIVIALPLVSRFVPPAKFSAAAGEVVGRIQAVDRLAHAFVLDDGTRLWVDEGRLVELREGATVQAIYAEKDGKNVVTELVIRPIADGAELSDFAGSRPLFDDRSIQASD